MIEILENFLAGVMEFGYEHNVDPRIFAVLYVTSTPPIFTLYCVGGAQNPKKRAPFLADN